MASDGGGELCRRQLAAGEIVADLGRDLARAVDAADVLDREHRGQAPPTLDGGQRLDLGAGEDAPAHQPAVALVKGIEAGLQGATQREGFGLEPALYLSMRLLLIALEGQQIVAATAGDLRGNLGLAGERVQADQAASQVQAVEQIGQHHQLAPFGIRRTLRQHQPVLDRERADQVQGQVAVPAVERPPYCLAVDRDLPGNASIGPEHRADPVEKAALEALRVDQHQHAAEGVVRGDAAPQLEEALQPIPLATPVEGDVLEALGLADHGADRDHQDVEQLVLDPAVAAWVFDPGELADQRLEHGFLLVARGEAYPVRSPD